MSIKTGWKKDNTGSYIVFTQGTRNIEVTFEYTNLFESDEGITAHTTTHDSELNQQGTLSYWANQPDLAQGIYRRLLIVQYGDLATRGIYNNQIQVTTNKGRIYTHNYRVKVV